MAILSRIINGLKTVVECFQVVCISFIRNNRNDCFCPERWIICCLGRQRLCLHVLTSVNTIVLDIVYAEPCSSTQVLTSIYLPCIPPQSIQTIAPGLGWGGHFLTFTVFLESKGLLCKSRKYGNSPHIRTWIFQFGLNRFLYKWHVQFTTKFSPILIGLNWSCGTIVFIRGGPLSAHSACPPKIPGWIVVVREIFL